MKNIFALFLLISLFIFFIGCENDKSEIEYVVNSDLNVFPAKIIYVNSNQKEITLVDVTLPWEYSFKAEGGDQINLSADIYLTGNINFTGTDTMRLKILLNGSVFKEAKGIIINNSMDEVSIGGTVPD